MPCRVPKRRFSCGAPQHLTKNQNTVSTTCFVLFPIIINSRPILATDVVHRLLFYGDLTPCYKINVTF